MTPTMVGVMTPERDIPVYVIEKVLPDRLYVVKDEEGHPVTGFGHATESDAQREIERLSGHVDHMVTTYATAHGWTWGCACGKRASGVGAIKTQTAAYSAGERHIATERRKSL